MRLMCISILAVLGIVFFASIAASLTIPSDNNKPVVSDEVRELFRSVNNDGQEPTDNAGAAPRDSSRGGERDEKHPAIISTGNLIQIKKEIHPPNDEGYLVEDYVGIFVEVRCNQNLDKIRIKEFVDNEITIINTSQYAYRLVTPDEISDYNSRFNDDYFKDFDYCENEYKQEESKIHSNDKINNLIIGGINCIYDYNCNLSYQGNLINFLRDDLGVPWAKDVCTSLGKNNLKICDKNNSSRNITIDFNKKKTQGLLNYENRVYSFFIKCDNMHCAIERSIGMNNKTNKKDVNYEERLFNLSIYNLQNDFDIEIISPRINERYAYWYYAKLKKPGDFKSTTTVLTSYGGVRNVPDIESSFPIKVANPSPEVNIRLNKLHLLKEEQFDIVYEIKYPERLNCLNKVYINFPQLNDYYSFVNGTDGAKLDNDKTISIRLDETNSANISRTIKFNDSGEYYLPGIIINNEFFPFQNQKVIIDTRFERYAQFVTLLSGIVAFFLKDFIFPGRRNEHEVGNNNQLKFSGLDIIEITRIVIIFILLSGSLIFIYWFYSDSPFLFLP